jgi:Zn-dependent M16 (insulinase) family peptidase
LRTKPNLKPIKEQLSENELNQLIHETKALIQYQESKDSPEDIAKIPNLSLSDIDKKASYYAAEYKEINNHKILFYNDHTNDIVYLKLFFDLRVLPQEMIPYVSLLSDLLGAVDTKNYSYEDLNKAINNHTGGIQTSLILYLENNDDDNLIPKFLVSSKATVSKRDVLLELNKEIVCNSLFNDTNRLKNLIKRIHVQLQSQFYRDGSRLASGRLSSYISKSGLFNEYVSGYEYYLFLSDLVKELDKNPGKIIDNLNNVSRLLFTKDNLMIGLACNTDNFNTLIPQLPLLSDALQTHTSTYKKWNLTLKNKNEAFSTSSKVQYVYSGYNFNQLGYEYNGKMQVLNKIMSRDWLNQEIRIKGGAYGGYSTLSYAGNVSFVSYRDPNLSETLEKYKQTYDFLQNLQLSEKEMTQFIIGTIAGLDQPKNITAKSMSAFGNYFTKTDASFYQKERDAILSTSVEDIRSYAKMIKEIAHKNVVCVYGNAVKLESNKQLFSKLIKIE